MLCHLVQKVCVQRILWHSQIAMQLVPEYYTTEGPISLGRLSLSQTAALGEVVTGGRRMLRVSDMVWRQTLRITVTEGVTRQTSLMS